MGRINAVRCVKKRHAAMCIHKIQVILAVLLQFFHYNLLLFGDFIYVVIFIYVIFYKLFLSFIVVLYVQLCEEQ